MIEAIDGPGLRGRGRGRGRAVASPERRKIGIISGRIFRRGRARILAPKTRAISGMRMKRSRAERSREGGGKDEAKTEAAYTRR